MTTFEAREQIRRAMVQAGPDAALVSRPVISSEPDGPAVMHPSPLPAIAAAQQLRWAATAALHEQVRYARGDGVPWLAIGHAVYGPDSRMTPADVQAEAFCYVASDMGEGPSFRWTCGTCHSAVTDRGPETGNPRDAEQGHADGCARFAAAVRAWEAEG